MFVEFFVAIRLHLIDVAFLAFRLHRLFCHLLLLVALIKRGTYTFLLLVLFLPRYCCRFLNLPPSLVIRLILYHHLFNNFRILLFYYCQHVIEHLSHRCISIIFLNFVFSNVFLRRFTIWIILDLIQHLHNYYLSSRMYFTTS